MRTEDGKVFGDVHVRDELEMRGQVTGKVVVESGGRIHLLGQCSQGLVVKAGGQAIVRGMVVGAVRNEGGYLEVLGMVVGSIITTLQGETVVGHNAVVTEGFV